MSNSSLCIAFDELQGDSPLGSILGWPGSLTGDPTFLGGGLGIGFAANG